MIRPIIYGWRGANIGNILEFETRYPDAKVIPLGENFRSTKTIVSAADALIRNNEQRKPKNLVAANDVGNCVRVRRLEDERAEAQDVVDRLKEMERSGTAWSEMAVLYRMNALSRVCEEVLRREGVPYIVAKGTSFFERKEVRDAVGYLRLLANPRDEVALERVVNMPPRGIGSTSWSRVVGEARACNEPVWEVMQSPSRIEGVSARAAKAIESFVEMIQNWRSALGQTGGLDDLSHELSDVVQRVIDESGLAAHYARGGTEEDHDRVENLDELVSAAADFPGVISEFPGLIEDGEEDFEGDVQSLEAHLFGWLESISLVADSDQVDPTRGVLTLMSLHASKGLEFEEVVVAGCEESVLPHLRSIGDDDAIEEERRLLFVGMTRAKKNLTLTSAKSRPVRGFRERTMESQFLSEIPNELVERWEANETESADPFLQSGSPSSLRCSAVPVVAASPASSRLAASWNTSNSAWGEWKPSCHAPPERRAYRFSVRRGQDHHLGVRQIGAFGVNSEQVRAIALELGFGSVGIGPRSPNVRRHTCLDRSRMSRRDGVDGIPPRRGRGSRPRASWCHSGDLCVGPVSRLSIRRRSSTVWARGSIRTRPGLSRPYAETFAAIRGACLPPFLMGLSVLAWTRCRCWNVTLPAVRAWVGSASTLC